MVQWISYLFIKGMTLWNTLTDWVSTLSYYTMDFSKYIVHYFHKDHSTWYLLPQHSLPLSHKNIKNCISPQWKYSASRHILEQSNPRSLLSTYSIDWLSATLSIQSYENKKIDEYPMDEFLEKLHILSDGSILPTLRDLFLIWCCDTHYWFSQADHVLFNIIDSNGESRSYPIDHSSFSFIIERTKLKIKHSY